MAPVIATIIIVIAWLVFILIYALQWSNAFSIFQNVIVTIVSLAITGLLIGLMWIIWGSRHSWKFDEYRWDFETRKK
jgi:hypothetical protein